MTNSKSNELIAELFSDSMDIEILCSIYENEVTTETIANLLSVDKEEVAQHLELLCKLSLVSKKQKDNVILFSLINPKVCDSILMLRDSTGYR